MSAASAELQFQVDRDLAERSGSGTFMYAIGAVVILAATGFYRVHALPSLLLTALVVACAAGRIWLNRNVAHWPRHRAVSWRRAFGGLFVLNGLAWGGVAALLAVDGVTEMPFLLGVVTTGGFSMGGLTVTTPDLRLTRIFAVAILTPPILAAGTVGGAGAVALGILVVVYIAFCFYLSSKLHREYWIYLDANVRLRDHARELKAARLAAEEAARAKSEFLATMSHEIRTPMNGVIGMADLLASADLPQEHAECARTIRSSGNQLLAIINDILDYSKIEAGMLVLEEEPTDPLAIVDEVLEMLVSTSAAKRIPLLHVPAAPEPRLVKADAARLRQILLNLVNNAIKFTSAGEIVVRSSWHRDADGQLRLVLAVSDTGVGMAPEVLNRIFDPFAQADSSTTRRYGGTGLGLAIVRRICTAMDGTVTVESQPDVGTVFTVEVPVQEAAEPAATAGGANALPGRVLVLTGHATTAEVVTAAFPADRTEVRVADRLAAPLDLGGWLPEVVLVDAALVGDRGADLERLMDAPELAGAGWIELRCYRDRDCAGLPGAPPMVRKPLKAPALRRACAEAAGLAAREAKPAAEAPRDLGLHVLVVEDNTVNQRVVGRMLDKLGCTAVVACDGQEAVERIAADEFDLVLMDCQMPVMDGLEATRAVRGLEGERSRVPIIALTAAASATDRDRCAAVGMDGYLSKPVKLHTLGDAIAPFARIRTGA